MKPYLVALGAGILVGAIYGLLSVRSPAPPVIALVGLLGMLLGEQAVPVARHLLDGGQISISWLSAKCGNHIFGELPASQIASASRPQAARDH
jgi:XapX domain-containing protein